MSEQAKTFECRINAAQTDHELVAIMGSMCDIYDLGGLTIREFTDLDRALNDKMKKIGGSW